MSSSPSVPAVPNPSDVANTQTGLNTNAATSSQAGSMVNQNNAFGSLNYTQTGTGPNGTPLYTANTSLSPTEQGLFNSYTSGQQTAGNQANALLTGANYGAIPAATAIGNATSGLTGAAMKQEIDYLNPYFTTQASQLDSQLRNQGINPSDPAYVNAMRNLQNNQGNTVTGFEASIEPQMFSQAQSTYELPAQLAESLGGYGAPTTPNSSFVSTPQLNISPASYEGDVSSANSANMAAYQAQLGQSNAMTSGLFGLGSAALGGLAKGGSLTGLSGLFGGAGAADGSIAASMGLGSGISDADLLESLALV